MKPAGSPDRRARTATRRKFAASLFGIVAPPQRAGQWSSHVATLRSADATRVIVSARICVYPIRVIPGRERKRASPESLTTSRGLKAHEFIINETIEYTRNCKAFGQSILDNQTVHFKVAEMQTEVELLRALTYRAAEALIAGEDVTRLATMAKLKAGRLGRELIDACLQFWGGMGFMNEMPVSRACCDTRLTSIGGGADEVMLGVLCKMMGTLLGANKKENAG
jgi:hypothetical protein